jgi:GGDEF domain-containing protein
LPLSCRTVRRHDRLRSLNPVTVDWEGNSYSTGASIGMALRDSSFTSESQWLEAADQACYRAKHQGRGALCLAHADRREPGSAHRI